MKGNRNLDDMSDEEVIELLKKRASEMRELLVQIRDQLKRVEGK
ncbi:MAG: hypothetical protein ACP5LS_06035 [Thermoprotei archaeon]|jgi:hypothetical protein